jgi:hypothetical protein
MRIRLRLNGARTGKVVVLSSPPTHASLVAAALSKLVTRKGKPSSGARRTTEGNSGGSGGVDASTVDTLSARLFLDGGDEVEAAHIESGDTVYISFEGSEFIDDTRWSLGAVPSSTTAGGLRMGDAWDEGERKGPMNGVASPPRGASLDRQVSRKRGSSLDDALVRLVCGKPFACFVSHAKAEAAMEARFVQTWLEKRLSSDRGRATVFLDSDNLKDLTQLTQHVKDSAVFILIQSKIVLTRPYCLLELLTAIKHDVPIVGLCLMGVSAQYKFEDAQHWLGNLDSLLEDNEYAYVRRRGKVGKRGGGGEREGEERAESPLGLGVCNNTFTTP